MMMESVLLWLRRLMALSPNWTTVDIRATQGQYPLAPLPDELVARIVDLLSYDDLRSFILCCKVFASKRGVHEEFSSHSRLHIPVSGSTAFTDPISLSVERLPTSYVVNDPARLLTIRALHDKVCSLKIQDARSFIIERGSSVHPLLPLRSLPHLIALEIDTNQQELLDVGAIHTAAPQLMRLRVSVPWQAKITNCHVLRKFTRLRALNLWLWEDWDTENVVGIPLLSELSIDRNDCKSAIRLRNIHALARVHPLRVLSLRGKWDHQQLTNALTAHLRTLRTLRVVEAPPWSLSFVSRARELLELRACIDLGASLASSPTLGTQLRVLELRYHKQIDIQALVVLSSLEKLTLSMHADAMNCCALRHLHKLRWLQLHDGWLRDFIAYLPLLESLTILDGVSKRAFSEPVVPLIGFVSPVRCFTTGSLTAIGHSAFARSVLANVEQVTIAYPANTPAMLASIWPLPKLKRLAVHHYLDEWFFWRLASNLERLEELEELYVDCLQLRWLPWWFARAQRLRVFVLTSTTSLRVISTLRSLEYIYLPLYKGNDIALLRSLHRLREVSLCWDCCCQPLREACGPGGALSELRRILHPTTNCLAWETCPCNPEANEYGDYMAELKPRWVTIPE